ncbi:MAG: LysM peptidoglycan-binding domain-containing protein [Opitutaceae bacterium]
MRDKLRLMLRFAFALAVLPAVFGQGTQVEIANLREDVRGLSQRVAELTLRLEQVERENAELRRKSAAVDKAGAASAKFKEELADLNRDLRAAIASSKTETLQQVASQMEKLAKQTNAALDSLAKGGAKPAGGVTFAEDFPKEGVSYTVQKGDTLATIARKTGARQQDIINANRLTDPSRITVGQTLFIPGGK